MRTAAVRAAASAMRAAAADVRRTCCTGGTACATHRAALNAFRSAACLLAHLATAVARLGVRTAIVATSVDVATTIAVVVAATITTLVGSTARIAAMVVVASSTMVDAMIVATVVVIAAMIHSLVPWSTGSVVRSGVMTRTCSVRTEVVATTSAMDGTRMCIHVVMIAASAIVAVRKVMTSVASVIGVVDQRSIIVEEPMVRVDVEDAEQPVAGIRIDGAEEIIQRNECQILSLRHDVTQVVVAVIEVIVVPVDILGIAVHHFVHDGIDRCNEIIVDLIAVLNLLRREVKLVGHAVGQEACVLADRHGGQGEGLNRSGDGYCQGNK